MKSDLLYVFKIWKILMLISLFAGLFWGVGLGLCHFDIRFGLQIFMMATGVYVIGFSVFALLSIVVAFCVELLKK